MPEAAAIIPPDGGWGWVVMIASFFCNMFVDGIVFNFSPFIKEIQRDFNASTAEVALVGSLLSGFYLMAGPFVSVLSAKIGFRWVTILGSVIAASAFSLCYFVNNIYLMYLVYGVIGGIGVCFIFVSSVLTVGYYFDKWRAMATGLALCGSGIGTSIFAKILPMLIKDHGWKKVMLMQGGLFSVCIIFALAFRPLKPAVINDQLLSKKPEKVRQSLAAYTSSLSDVQDSKGKVVRSYTRASSRRETVVEDLFFSGSMIRIHEDKQETFLQWLMSLVFDVTLCKSPSFVLLASSGFFTMMGFFVPFVYMAKRAEAAGIDADTALMFVSTIGISNTIARVICGVLTSFDTISALLVNNIAICMGGIATIFSGYIMEEWSQYLYAILFGICIASFSALRSTMVVDLLGLEKLTNAYGALMLFQGIAAIFGTPVAGVIYDSTKSYTASFWFAGGLITLSAVLCFPLGCINRWEKKRNEEN